MGSVLRWKKPLLAFYRFFVFNKKDLNPHWMLDVERSMLDVRLY
jgi:hypothetical protein